MLRVITFKLDESLLEKLDRIALRERKNRSDIIREAIEEYILRYYYGGSAARVRVEAIRIW